MDCRQSTQRSFAQSFKHRGADGWLNQDIHPRCPATGLPAIQSILSIFFKRAHARRRADLNRSAANLQGHPRSAGPGQDGVSPFLVDGFFDHGAVQAKYSFTPRGQYLPSQLQLVLAHG